MCYSFRSENEDPFLSFTQPDLQSDQMFYHKLQGFIFEDSVFDYNNLKYCADVFLGLYKNTNHCSST